jgi:chitinase
MILTRSGTCSGNKGVSYCCDQGVDTSSCYWNEGTTDILHAACDGANMCKHAGDSRITVDQWGGPDSDGKTHQCLYPIPGRMVWTWLNAYLAFCCNPSKMGKASLRRHMRLH